MCEKLIQALQQQALSFEAKIPEERCAVNVQDNGTVEFYLYAPSAETAEVAGVGGTTIRADFLFREKTSHK